MKKIFIIAFFIVILSALLGYGYIINTPKKSFQVLPDKKPSIVTSFYPLYFFTSQIVGDEAYVYNITPPGAEPHDYEPTTQDIARLEKSNLIILNGGRFEPWADNMEKNLKNSSTKIVLSAEKIMTGQDPHVWLSPELAQKQVETILLALQNIDPVNKEKYQTNASVLIRKLNSLDQEFRQSLSTCTKRVIVTSHDAYGYVAHSYNLQQLPISGLSPDSEPSPKQLSDVAKLARDNNVKYIFFETLLSPKYAETIAHEVGAKTLVFNPLEGLTTEEQNQGKDYFGVQRENLSNLKKALECK